MEESVLLEEHENFSLYLNPVEHQHCSEWSKDTEGPFFHLAHMMLLFGFMGGSGLYGLLYMFSFLSLGFLCASVWAWSSPCTNDAFSWAFVLFVICVVQVVHAAYRLRSVSFNKEFQELYARMFKRLGVSLIQFGRIVSSCEQEICTIEKEHYFAMEGKTPIDKLSILLSGRIRVTVNGEFLHYIYPFQFLDSPEWDSLRPSEEGVFQVTLKADDDCRYVTWRRKKLYLLFAKHRYIAKIFALVVRNDIADKLYSLNDRALDKQGFHYDLRLPSFCHKED
ncbi:popeye domain-containing protein 3 [Trichomycterus rosablanca]|uniref:popeye domain-containing protein 3 n=1 Tax=Trichomycterus rosablanca TaxID=2290929 RepID=UPI002F35C839